jgi:hypothetical protein
MPLKDKPNDSIVAAESLEPIVPEVLAVPEPLIDPPTVEEIIVTATPESAEKIAIAEHQTFRQPDATKIVFWAGNLITAMVPNPCGLKPGTLYTMAEIDAVVSPEMIQADAA